jgi:hypothetical protein
MRRFGGVAACSTPCCEMLEKDATHIGVATDHVIESFRNELVARLQDVGRHGAARCSRNSIRSRRRCRDGRVVWPMVGAGGGRRARIGGALAAADARVQKVLHLDARQRISRNAWRTGRVVQMDARRVMAR